MYLSRTAYDHGKRNNADLVNQAFLVYTHMLRHVIGVDKSIPTPNRMPGNIKKKKKNKKKDIKKPGQYDCRKEAAVDADNRVSSYKGDRNG